MTFWGFLAPGVARNDMGGLVFRPKILDAIALQAQAALLDWEAEQRQLAQQRQQAALNHLRQIAIEHALLAPAGKGIDVSNLRF